MNPRCGTVHRGGEKRKSVRCMTSRRGRCAPKAEGGQRAPVLCDGRGERGDGGDVGDELMSGGYGGGKMNHVQFD
jgi:hypothetical protein